MNIFEQIAKELNIKVGQVENTVKLIDEGNTIPFIARYRKEVTGNLDDAALQAPAAFSSCQPCSLYIAYA